MFDCERLLRTLLRPELSAEIFFTNRNFVKFFFGKWKSRSTNEILKQKKIKIWAKIEIVANIYSLGKKNKIMAKNHNFGRHEHCKLYFDVFRKFYDVYREECLRQGRSTISVEITFRSK